MYLKWPERNGSVCVHKNHDRWTKVVRTPSHRERSRCVFPRLWSRSDVTWVPRTHAVSCCIYSRMLLRSVLPRSGTRHLSLSFFVWSQDTRSPLWEEDEIGKRFGPICSRNRTTAQLVPWGWSRSWRYPAKHYTFNFVFITCLTLQPYNKPYIFTRMESLLIQNVPLCVSEDLNHESDDRELRQLIASVQTTRTKVPIIFSY